MPRRANIRTGSACNLPATFPYVAGVARSEHWHSRSLLPTLHGEEDRDFAYCEWDLSDSHRIVPVNLRTVRTRRDKLTVETILGTVEIYDLEADPLEMNNIADDPRHAARRRELEAMIAQRPDDARKERLPAVGMA
jgi:arylsulfatase A-like enzyme